MNKTRIIITSFIWGGVWSSLLGSPFLRLDVYFLPSVIEGILFAYFPFRILPVNAVLSWIGGALTATMLAFYLNGFSIISFKFLASIIINLAILEIIIYLFYDPRKQEE